MSHSQRSATRTSIGSTYIYYSFLSFQTEYLVKLPKYIVYTVQRADNEKAKEQTLQQYSAPSTKQTLPGADTGLGTVCRSSDSLVIAEFQTDSGRLLLLLLLSSHKHATSKWRHTTTSTAWVATLIDNAGGNHVAMRR